MTADEYRRKCEEARETGMPVFLTLKELEFMSEFLMQFADRFYGVDPGQLTGRQQAEIMLVMTIGMKCARAFDGT